MKSSTLFQLRIMATEINFSTTTAQETYDRLKRCLDLSEDLLRKWYFYYCFNKVLPLRGSLIRCPWLTSLQKSWMDTQLRHQTKKNRKISLNLEVKARRRLSMREVSQVYYFFRNCWFVNIWEILRGWFGDNCRWCTRNNWAENQRGDPGFKRRWSCPTKWNWRWRKF